MTEEKWIPISDEKLPNFCHTCELLGCVMQDYEKNDNQGGGEWKFGICLQESNGSRGFIGERRMTQKIKVPKGKEEVEVAVG